MSLSKELKNQKMPVFPRGYSRGDTDMRWSILAKNTTIEKEHIEAIRQSYISGEVFKGSCENFIGTCQIPLGIIGPVKILSATHEDASAKTFIVPAATTEGSLIASYSRGCRVMNLSGGCTTLCHEQQFMTGPCLHFEGIKEAYRFSRWILTQEEKLKDTAKASDPFLSFKGCQPIIEGKRVFLNLFWETGDAAGQNMSFIGTDDVYRFICKNAPSNCSPTGVTLEACSGEKKASGASFYVNRGRKVTSECFIPDFILEKYLRVDSKVLANAHRDITTGGIIKGLAVNHLQFANFYAAVQIALGQDPANTAECTIGSVNLESVEKRWSEIKDKIAWGEISGIDDSIFNMDGNTIVRGVYASVLLPGVVCGIVGGGTRLPTQRAALSIVNAKSAGELAEVYAAVALAGELSFTAAIAASEWANAHKVHGRAEIPSQPTSGETTPVMTPEPVRRIIK